VISDFSNGGNYIFIYEVSSENWSRYQITKI